MGFCFADFCWAAFSSGDDWLAALVLSPELAPGFSLPEPGFRACLSVAFGVVEVSVDCVFRPSEGDGFSPVFAPGCGGFFDPAVSVAAFEPVVEGCPAGPVVFDSVVVCPDSGVAPFVEPAVDGWPVLAPVAVSVPDLPEAGGGVVFVPVVVGAVPGFCCSVVVPLAAEGEPWRCCWVVPLTVPVVERCCSVVVVVVRLSVATSRTGAGTGTASGAGRLRDWIVTWVSRSMTWGWIAKFTANAPRRSTRPMG